MTDLMILKTLSELKEELKGNTILTFSEGGKEIKVNEIRSLNLSNTDIKELPENIGLLNELQILDVSGTRITTLPWNIGKLRNLNTLNVSGSMLTTLPGSIQYCENLQYLNASNTRLGYLPGSIDFLTRLKTLDVSGTWLMNITESIGGLESLQTLNISRTWIASLPESIVNLKNLQTLDAHDTSLSKLSDDIASLSSLEKLDASDTYLKTLPESVGDLKNLQTLNISGTQLTTLPESIGKLKNLLTLNISGTWLQILPESIGDLKNLQTLNISGTQLTTLPESIEELGNLQTLNINDTQLTLPKSIGKLKSLKTLEASRIQRIDLNDSITKLENLNQLNFSGTEISDLSALSNLNNLTLLNLQYSQTTAIPESILDLNLDFITEEFKGRSWHTHTGILIHGIILTDQPSEIFGQTKELIRAYFREKDRVPVNECKVIFLGDAESGKTHSIRRLLNKGDYLYDFNGEATPGIETTVSRINIKGSEITVNYWDFGGQEIQHSMHRVFLTERTVYVVFLNARQDDLMDERARYWLENIMAFAPAAPVLVVINKIDQNEHPRFNEKGFLEAYGDQVKRVIRLSAKTDKPQDFLDKLEGNINSIITDLPTVSKKVPKTWKKLMESIRTMPEHYLTTDEFKEKCISNRIADYMEIHDDLVDLFQVIGISFCYYKNRAIADYMLLNPKWMLNALYTIVTNGKAVARNGVITQNNLFDLLQEDAINGVKIRRVIPELHYKGFEINYILGVIRMFGLSYCMKDGSEFFPMLCDGDEKISVKAAVPENALHFIFRYKYLPTNVMHRLIVEMQRDLDYQYVWYTGAVFRNTQQKHTAYIHSAGNDLHIYVFGEDKYYNLNEYLTPISNIIRDINNNMRLSAVEFLTFSKNRAEARIPLKEVMGNIRNGILEIYNAEIDGKIQLDALARRYFDDRPKTDDLLKAIVYALQAMQTKNIYYSSDEDSRNSFVSANLNAQLKGTKLRSFEQLPGGTGKGGKAPGERDIVVKDENEQEILIYEGLNLKGVNTTTINSHIDKVLANYNTQGQRYSVLVNYLECARDKFKNIADKYREHIARYAPETYRCVWEPEDVRINGEFLTCMKMEYDVGGTRLFIYHIIVRMGK